jgi:hypothetical protein
MEQQNKEKLKKYNHDYNLLICDMPRVKALPRYELQQTTSQETADQLLTDCLIRQKQKEKQLKWL